jgi:hypothetical protein
MNQESKRKYLRIVLYFKRKKLSGFGGSHSSQRLSTAA